MATNLNIKYEEASAQAKLVLDAAEEIRMILQNLVSEVDSNVGNSSVWTGDAAQRFKSAWDNCADSFESFVNHIKTIQEKIDYTYNEVKSYENSSIA